MFLSTDAREKKMFDFHYCKHLIFHLIFTELSRRRLGPSRACPAAARRRGGPRRARSGTRRRAARRATRRLCLRARMKNNEQ